MISFACAAAACMEAKDETGRVKEGDRCSEQRRVCCCPCLSEESLLLPKPGSRKTPEGI